jgi:hypothetical protein
MRGFGRGNLLIRKFRLTVGHFGFTHPLAGVNRRTDEEDLRGQLKMKRIISVLACLPILGGGFYIQLGAPAASPHPDARGAILVARLDGCHEPGRGTLEATAEGLAGGRRQSIPLTPVALGKEGTYAIRKAWPDEGRWVVKLVARHPAFQIPTFLIVPVNGNSFNRGQVIRDMRLPAEADLAKALTAE